LAEREVGEELGQYRLLRELGRGGMGRVFEAEQVRLGRTVAVKILAPRAAADPAFRERFVRESQLLAAMEHPNIIPIYDAGEVDGLLYIAMRYVAGEDLGEEIGRGATDPRSMLAILEQVGGALDAAHVRGLVHRDVKPANVLIDESASRVFLSDFGVAKLADARQATKAGTILGTIHYAAPEQLQGHRVGPAADVYALGCVLFEALSGRRPFDKETEVAVIFAHAIEPPPELSVLRPELPPTIDAVIAKALAKDPADRYESGRALVAAARDALGIVARAAAPAAPRAGAVQQRHAPAGEPAAAPPRVTLPRSTTPLIGRDRELAEVKDLLVREGVRMVTLTGPGGVGKTRLAIAAARRVEAEFSGGVAFVDLSTVPDPSLLVSTLADALGVAEPADAGDRGARLLEAVISRLEGAPTLVVFDNFEHLLAGAAIVGQFLAAAPAFTALVTSHAPLHLVEEHEYPVPPLGVPALREGADLGTVAGAPAVALFLERARAVVPDFQLTRENVAAVTAICARLDGLPLAIELVVARLRVLSPEDVLSRLENALDLTAGSEDLPPRHRTLRAAIDSSYQLLDCGEQALFRRLAVFAGGCTLAAAEEICAGREGEPLPVLEAAESLTAKSLLRRRIGDTGEARLVMLQSIHEYALYRLLEVGERDELRRRHAHYYLGLAEQAELELVGQG
jgi:predicted ATPase